MAAIRDRLDSVDTETPGQRLRVEGVGGHKWPPVLFRGVGALLVKNQTSLPHGGGHTSAWPPGVDANPSKALLNTVLPQSPPCPFAPELKLTSGCLAFTEPLGF